MSPCVSVHPWVPHLLLAVLPVDEDDVHPVVVVVGSPLVVVPSHALVASYY